jgi:D-alanine-D-alanine ligase
MDMNLQSMNGTVRVGVLRGGPSHEYDVSLKTGAHIMKHLPKQYQVKDIVISRDGDWHIDGVARNPGRVLSQVDVVFNALHGNYGEDGKVQQILGAFGTPFTGSKTFPSALGQHKALAKKTYNLHKIKTPVFVVLQPKDNTWNNIVGVFQSFPQPSIVKPISGGSSLATAIATDFVSFEKAVEQAFRFGSAVLIEEYIIGREATCGVLDSLDGSQSYALFPVEIITEAQKIFNKLSPAPNLCQELCPSTFSQSTKQELQEISLTSHMALGLRHYSRSDYIISPRGIYLLETNSLPGLSEDSLYPKSLEAAGVSFQEFLDHVLTLTLSKTS